jgi:NAD(P)-dependent dehydrogenase (short-subunit alcohol dehydrogenase family)
VYSAAKRGGEAFFEALASQYATSPSVRVAIVQPGVVDTGMQARLREHATSPTTFFPDRQRFLDLHTDGGLADPVDVARRIIGEHLR